MLPFLPLVLNVLGPAAIAFLTPERSKLLFKAVMETIDAVGAKVGDQPADVQIKEFGEALSSNLDVAFSLIPGFEDEKAEMKTRLVPWFTGLIYGSPDPDATPESETPDV